MAAPARAATGRTLESIFAAERDYDQVTLGVVHQGVQERMKHGDYKYSEDSGELSCHRGGWGREPPAEAIT